MVRRLVFDISGFFFLLPFLLLSVGTSTGWGSLSDRVTHISPRVWLLSSPSFFFFFWLLWFYIKLLLLFLEILRDTAKNLLCSRNSSFCSHLYQQPNFPLVIGINYSRQKHSLFFFSSSPCLLVQGIGLKWPISFSNPVEPLLCPLIEALPPCELRPLN